MSRSGCGVRASRPRSAVTVSQSDRCVVAGSYGSSVSSDRVLLRLAQGYQLPQLLYVVVKLGVADVIAAAGSTAEDVAAAVQARPDELRRVLRSVVAAGVFIEMADGRFAMNDSARRCVQMHRALSGTS